MLFIAGLPAEVPKGAVDSTETLMENAKVTDKVDEMTDGPIENPSGNEGGSEGGSEGSASSVATAVQRLTPDVDTVSIS